MMSSQPVFPSVSLRDLARPLFRHRGLMLVVSVIATVVFLVAGILILHTYKSQMAVLVGRERHDPLVTTEATSQAPPVGAADQVTVEEVNSEAELLVSQDILEQVVRTTGLDKKPSIIATLTALTPEEKVEKAARQLAKDLKVKNETNSNLITVSYKSADPQLSFKVLDSLGDLYVAKHVAVHRAPGTVQFFTDQASRYKQALNRDESDLQKLDETNHIAAPADVRGDLAQEVATATGVMYTASAAAAADDRRIASDQQQMARLQPRAVSLHQTAPADRLLEDLNVNLSAAEAHRTQLMAKYESGYPLVREVDQEITALKQQIVEAHKEQYVSETTAMDPEYELLREDVAKTRADLASQQATVTAAKQNISKMQDQMVSLDHQQLQQNDVEREMKADEGNYLLYLAKREQERATSALDKTKISNVSIAVPPAIPMLPILGWPVLISASIGLGILFAMIAAYIADYFDASFHSREEIEDVLGIPFVVAIPRKTA